MNAFAAALDAIFEDPNMAVDAWHRGGEGEFTPVRIVVRMPDEIGAFNEGRFVTDSILIEVRTRDLPALAAGDEFQVAAEVFEVRGEPRRDAHRLVWRCEARAR